MFRAWRACHRTSKRERIKGSIHPCSQPPLLFPSTWGSYSYQRESKGKKFFSFPRACRFDCVLAVRYPCMHHFHLLSFLPSLVSCNDGVLYIARQGPKPFRSFFHSFL